MINKYPDGSSYAKIKLAGPYEIPSVSSFTHRLNSYEDLWHLNQIVDVYKHLEVKPTITIPCLIDAQADRRFKKDESSGLKLVCKFLNSMWADFKIFHPHNSEVVESLIDNVEIIDNSEFIKQVLFKLSTTSIPDRECKCGDTRWCKRVPGEGSYCKDLGLQWYKDNIKPTNDNLVILLPDGGAFKWGTKLMNKLDFSGDVIAAAKNRKFVDNKSVLTQQLPDYDFKNKDILIIDDICIYGGTFKGLSKLLKERNCGKLYLGVSHMTVENLGEDPVTNYFDKVFTTNSKYDNYFTKDSEAGGKQPDNLIIIKMF